MDNSKQLRDRKAICIKIKIPVLVSLYRDTFCAAQIMPMQVVAVSLMLAWQTG